MPTHTGFALAQGWLRQVGKDKLAPHHWLEHCPAHDQGSHPTRFRPWLVTADRPSLSPALAESAGDEKPMPPLQDSEAVLPPPHVSMPDEPLAPRHAKDRGTGHR
ncbi:hypothetical protein DSL92_00370 [Billgrantia gudaonensis]|uniref:Uncharacterized protein n=1 Tax=Billgrantia gudaonensis TaxID=376427 RepID=A0A432JKX9_9GAMM|nr:hypothetical protein DSL92_00370 [Halomonas gudaonensis]